MKKLLATALLSVAGLYAQATAPAKKPSVICPPYKGPCALNKAVLAPVTVGLYDHGVLRGKTETLGAQRCTGQASALNDIVLCNDQEYTISIPKAPKGYEQRLLMPSHQDPRLNAELRKAVTRNGLELKLTMT